MPTPKFTEALEDRRTHGVQIVTITNDFKGTEEPVAERTRHYTERDNKERQITMGLSQFGKLSQRWDLTPEKSRFMLHAKVYVADKRDEAEALALLQTALPATEIELCPAVICRPGLLIEVEGVALG